MKLSTIKVLIGVAGITFSLTGFASAGANQNLQDMEDSGQLNLGGTFSESEADQAIRWIRQEMGSSNSDATPIEVAYKKGCKDGVYKQCTPVWGSSFPHTACSIAFCDEATYNKWSQPCYPGDRMAGAPHLCFGKEN